jgi:2-polyprenyl-6-methoxyphenol hydroxylase-like FAD-dependent oxidoreductase
MPESVPCVIIVGGGFGGLAAAKALRNTPARVILIDRSNHHLFQPLLAWLAWAAIHLEFLAQRSLRVSVFVQWVWTFVTGQRGSRLIVDHTGPGSAKSIPAIASAAAPSSQPPVTAVVSSK